MQGLSLPLAAAVRAAWTPPVGAHAALPPTPPWAPPLPPIQRHLMTTLPTAMLRLMPLQLPLQQPDAKLPRRSWHRSSE